MGACGSCSKKDVVDAADVAIEDGKPVKEATAPAAAAPAAAEEAKGSVALSPPARSSDTIELSPQEDKEREAEEEQEQQQRKLCA